MCRGTINWRPRHGRQLRPVSENDDLTRALRLLLQAAREYPRCPQQPGHGVSHGAGVGRARWHHLELQLVVFAANGWGQQLAKEAFPIIAAGFRRENDEDVDTAGF